MLDILPASCHPAQAPIRDRLPGSVRKELNVNRFVCLHTLKGRNASRWSPTPSRDTMVVIIVVMVQCELQKNPAKKSVIAHAPSSMLQRVRRGRKAFPVLRAGPCGSSYRPQNFSHSCSICVVRSLAGCAESGELLARSVSLPNVITVDFRQSAPAKVPPGCIMVSSHLTTR